MATRDEIKGAIIYMRSLFPNYHPELDGDYNAVDAMFDVLGDLESETLRAGVKAACMDSMDGRGREFAPSAGAIRAAAVQLHIKASGIPTTEEAWQIVLKAINSEDRWAAIKPYPLIMQAVDTLGGLRLIADSEAPGVERAHFFRIYDNLLQEAARDAGQLPALTAYVEQHRQLNGGAIPQLTEGKAK